MKEYLDSAAVHLRRAEEANQRELSVIATGRVILAVNDLLAVVQRLVERSDDGQDQ
jgi:hypothetical protein